MTSIRMTGTCGSFSSHQAAASRRSRANLVGVMASNGCPYASVDRVLTSTKATTSPRAAMMSISP